MSATAPAHPAPSVGAPEAARPGAGGPRGRGGGPVLRGTLIVLGVLAVAALSLVPLPATPSYDPWAWIVWGREITQGDLSTVAGPSWKPLTVLFTTALAPFGDAAPQMWLVIARAGALATLLMLWRLGRRLGAPSAGVLAALALALTPWWLRNAAVGNSEALMAALALGMLDRHLAGRYVTAYLCGIGAALLRPEAWPFLFLYALGLAWVRRHELRTVAIVAAGLVLQPIAWLVPERIGSGSFLRAAERARTPDANAATFTDHPALTVLGRALSMLPPIAWGGVVAALVLLALALRGGGRGVPAAADAVTREEADAVAARSRRSLLVVAGVAVVWTGGVMAMTVGGFSGNARYLVMPVVLILLVALVALATALARLPRGPRIALLGLAGVLALVPGVLGLRAERDRMIFQREAIGEIPGLLAQAGGTARIQRCGEITTNRYLVPALAWQMRLPTRVIGFEPGPAGAVLFSTPHDPRAAVEALAPPVRGARVVHHELLARGRPLPQRRLAAAGVARDRGDGGVRGMSSTIAPKGSVPGGATGAAEAAPEPERERTPRARLRAARPALLVGLGLLALMAFSVWLRTRHLDAAPWIDEGLSVGIGSFPLGDIPVELQKDGSPPLYYLLVNVWMRLTGTDAMDVLRVLSVIPTVVGVPVAWWAARRPLGVRAAWGAAAAAATLPYLTYFGQEARMYSFVALGSLVLAGLHLRAFGSWNAAAGRVPSARSQWWALAYGATLAVLVYLHNWSIFLGAAGVLATLLPLRGADRAGRRRLARDVVVAHGATLLLVLPWLPTLLQQSRETGAPWSAAPNVTQLFSVVSSLGGRPGPGAGLVLLLVGVGVAVHGLRPSPTLRRRVGALGALLVGTVVLGWIASQVSPAWAIRYMAVLVGPTILLLGAAVSTRSRIVTVATLLLIVGWGFDPLGSRLEHKGGPRGMVDVAAPELRSGDLVLSTHPEQVPVLSYELSHRGGPSGLRYATALGPAPETRIFDWRNALDRLQRTKPAPTARRLVADQRPGSRVLLVQPVIGTGNWEGPWTKLIARRRADWARALSSDGRLTELRRIPSGRTSPFDSGLYGILYRVDR